MPKETGLKVAVFAQHLIDAILTISILSFIIIPMALAEENQASPTGEHRAQPVVSATTNAEAQNAMIKTLESLLRAWPRASLNASL